jgi:hydroxyacylglutathione hydrolase
MTVEIRKITVGKARENCYFLSCGNEAFLVDPGDDYLAIVKAFDLDSFNIKAIINTHGHYDHIGAIVDLKERYDVPFLIHSADKRIVSRGNLYKRVTGDLEEFKTPSIDGVLDNVTTLDISDQKIKVFYTPGHTGGCVCFGFSNSLIVGDMVFEHSIGRTDLPGGNAKDMKNSLSFLKTNFLNCTIYPGHGNSFVLNDQKMKELNLK